MPRESSKRRWRFYTKPKGRSPVREFLDALTDDDAAEIVAAMKLVEQDGLVASRHLRGDIYEVRVDGRSASYRVLFSAEGKKGRILLALEAFSKKTQKTPPQLIVLAERRLRDWRTRER